MPCHLTESSRHKIGLSRSISWWRWPVPSVFRGKWWTALFPAFHNNWHLLTKSALLSNCFMDLLVVVQFRCGPSKVATLRGMHLPKLAFGRRMPRSLPLCLPFVSVWSGIRLPHLLFFKTIDVPFLRECTLTRTAL